MILKPTESEQAEINELRKNTFCPLIVHVSGLDNLPDPSECQVGSICKVHDSEDYSTYELMLTSTGWKSTEFTEKSCDWNEAEKEYNPLGTSSTGIFTDPAHNHCHINIDGGCSDIITYSDGTWKPSEFATKIEEYQHNHINIDGGGIDSSINIDDSMSISNHITYSSGTGLTIPESTLPEPDQWKLAHQIRDSLVYETTTDSQLTVTGTSSSTDLEEVVENFTTKLQKIMDRLDEIERSQDEMKEEIGKVFRALQAY